MKIVETLNTEEALGIFRSYGIPISFEKLVALIDSGAGERAGWSVCGRKPSGKPSRIIFRRPLIAWLESLAVEIA